MARNSRGTARPARGERRAPPPSRHVRPSLVAALVLVLSLAGGATWYLWARPTARADRWLTEARALHAAGDASGAERAAAAALAIDPSLGEAIQIAAECAASQGELERAIQYAEETSSANPQTALEVSLRSAQIGHHRLYQFAGAERAYRVALKIAPENVEANLGLANLLGMCARRFEAIPHVLRLVRLGQATDLLILLAREDSIIQNPDALRRARIAAPDDPNPPVALAWYAAESDRIDEAIGLLRQAIQIQPDHAAAHVALGGYLVDARRFDQIGDWNERLPAAAEEFPETWIVRARMAENQDDFKGAVRCYGEAARRAPQSKIANVRLSQLLSELGYAEIAARFAQHARHLQELTDIQDRALFSNNQSSIDVLLDLVQHYERVGRLWEALGWCQLAVEIDSHNIQARQSFQRLRQNAAELPLQVTVDATNVALDLDLSEYPLPNYQSPLATRAADGEASSGTMSFRDDADSAGLRFEYFSGFEGAPTRRMFEFTGGGVAVLDYDLDGLPDVYFTQGRPWPPDQPLGSHHDRLFRNLDATRFERVDAGMDAEMDGFGQGVTVGDFDADGFPDIYVANIGSNRLYRNNGDGTFTDITEQAGLMGDEWTTSCVMADLDGDGLADIYDVNYVTGDDVFDRICTDAQGHPALCMPFDFDAQPDRFWRNDGRGRFVDATADTLSVDPKGKGLGAAVWDADGTGRLSLMVANDTTPNFFFTPSSNADGEVGLQEQAIPRGLAFNGEGKAEGCMGIALGDVDDDGSLDVLVTNFYNESNTLYLSQRAGGYGDRTRAMGMHEPSIDTLGFGTQFLDVNLDGRLEAFVANGHVDDLTRHGRPYKMPAQLFRLGGQRFAPVAAAELGPYFQQAWLGRGVARLDWNRDGREDLVVGHLNDASSLLTNTTPEVGNFVAIKLVGVASARDAIGTTVEAHRGDRIILRQLTAGDGYHASNERRLVIGVGSAEKIDKLIVRWPSGTVQQFEGVATSQEMTLVEGRDAASRL